MAERSVSEPLRAFRPRGMMIPSEMGMPTYSASQFGAIWSEPPKKPAMLAMLNSPSPQSTKSLGCRSMALTNPTL